MEDVFFFLKRPRAAGGLGRRLGREPPPATFLYQKKKPPVRNTRSTFGTFCDIHAICTGGAFANFSNSVTDFGRRGLVARGYFRVPYLTGRVLRLPAETAEGVQPAWNSDTYNEYEYIKSGPGSRAPYYAGQVASLAFLDVGLGYTETPTVTIQPPWGAEGQVEGQQLAEASAAVALGASTLTDLLLKAGLSGRGYRAVPAVTVSPPLGYEGGTADDTLLGRRLALAEATITGVPKIRVAITGGIPLRFANNRKPDTLSIVRIHGRFYTVSGSSPVTGEVDTYDISFQGTEGGPPYVDVDHDLAFYQVSYVSTGSHTFEYCGSPLGCTYNSLPEFGGIPDPTNETSAVAPAKVFYTSSDHLGNQKVGEFFKIDQASGSVTLNAKNFDLSRISSLGPFLRNGVAQGVAMKEVSTNVDLRASTGVPDGSTVPTQTAVKQYVDKRAVPLNDATPPGYFLRWTGTGETQYQWLPATAENLGVISVAMRTDVINGLIADGDAKIFGNVTCDTLQALAGVEVTLPGAATAPTSLRTLAVDMVSDTALTFRVRGSDGVLRTAVLPLA